MKSRHPKFLTAAILAAALSTTPALATGLTGSFLVTLKGHPSSNNGNQYCLTIADTGGTLGYPVSGTVTLQDEEGRSYPGTWFAIHDVASFEVPLPEYSASPSFIVFSARIRKSGMVDTSFTETLNGAPYFDGTFTALQNGC